MLVFDPGMMPGTGLARSYPALLRFVWNYILPAFTLFKLNVHRPAKSGRRLAALVSDSSETPAGKYYSDGREARSSGVRPADRVLAWHLRPLRQGDGNGRQGVGLLTPDGPLLPRRTRDK